MTETPKEFRKFGGKTYQRTPNFVKPLKTRLDARAMTRGEKRHGFLTRIVKAKDGYWIYRRKAHQTLSPRSSDGKGTTHVRAHARKGTRGVRAHTRKR